MNCLQKFYNIIPIVSIYFGNDIKQSYLNLGWWRKCRAKQKTIWIRTGKAWIPASSNGIQVWHHCRYPETLNERNTWRKGWKYKTKDHKVFLPLTLSQNWSKRRKFLPKNWTIIWIIICLSRKQWNNFVRSGFFECEENKTNVFRPLASHILARWFELQSYLPFERKCEESYWKQSEGWGGKSEDGGRDGRKFAKMLDGI